MARNVGRSPGPILEEAMRDQLRIFSNFTASYIGQDNAGRPIYRIAGRTPEGHQINQTWAVDGEKLVGPDMRERVKQPALSPEGGRQVPTTDSMLLQRSKDRAASWITTYADWMSGVQATNYLRQIREFDGERGDFERLFAQIKAVVGAQGSAVARPVFDDGAFALPGFGGGGFGGGGGSLGPLYVAPDRRVVQDYVRGELTQLLGLAPPGHIEGFTELYMKEHRRNFDTEDQEVEPRQSVLEAIRGTTEYRRIHALRPEGADERTWVGARRQLGERGGLETGLDQFAINQATIAGTAEDVERAGAVQQFQKSGQMPTLLDNQFRQIAEAMSARVAR